MKTLALVVRTAPLLLVMSGNIYAEEICDCSVKKGNCNATLSVKPTSQPNGIHGASVKVAVDTASCARVDYYVEHTPTVAFLRHGGSLLENVTGSLGPMDPSMFTVDACRICEVRVITPPSGDESLAGDMFEDALSKKSRFNPGESSERIADFGSRSDSSSGVETLQMMINAAQQIQQVQQMQQPQPTTYQHKGLLDLKIKPGYEYSDTSVKPIPASK